MTKALQTFILLSLISCAHHFKDHIEIKDTTTLGLRAKIAENIAIKSKSHNADNFVIVDKIIPYLIETDSPKGPEYEVISFELLEYKNENNWGRTFPPMQLISIITLGIIPTFYDHKIIAKIGLKKTSTDKIKFIHVNMNYSNGSGWYYWFKALTQDDWMLRGSKNTRKYIVNQKEYFRDYLKWKINEE